MDELDGLIRCRESLQHFVADFEPGCWPGERATRLMAVIAEIERLVGAAKILTARQASRGSGWRAKGHRSAEEWLAAETGSSLSDASKVLATAEQIKQLPDTEQAIRDGKLSVDQAAEVASAGAADPLAERRLLADAGHTPLNVLRRDAQAVRNAARGRRCDDDQARIHATRYFRHWTSTDGAVEGKFRLTADAGAALLAAVAAQRNAVFAVARGDGRRDSSDALEADALVAVARAAAGSGDGAGPQVTLNVRVDHAALLRGHCEAGETCEIDGIGPVPVATVRAAASDAVLRALLVAGDNVIAARPAGRTVSAAQRRALTERDRRCVVPGCDRTRHLQIHHLHPVQLLGPTTMENLARVCSFHHDQITHRGARLEGPHPNWIWQPPPAGSPPPGPGGLQPPEHGVVATAPNGAGPPAVADAARLFS